MPIQRGPQGMLLRNRRPDSWIREQPDRQIRAPVAVMCRDNDVATHGGRDTDPNLHNSQPRVHVTRRGNDWQVHVGFGDALKRLEMNTAAKDLNRFKYVCKFLQSLAEDRFNSLSGTAKNVVMKVLGDLVDGVIVSQDNMAVVHDVLAAFSSTLETVFCTSRIGSTSLWKRHIATVQELQAKLDRTELRQRADDGGLYLESLPDECLLEIIYRLDNPDDVIRLGLASSRLFSLVRETVVWYRMCAFHFSKQQLHTSLLNQPGIQCTLHRHGWLPIFFKLKKQYGLREQFADQLLMCNHCSTIFWQYHGHPCIHRDQRPVSLPLLPKNFGTMLTSSW